MAASGVSKLSESSRRERNREYEFVQRTEWGAEEARADAAPGLGGLMPRARKPKIPAPRETAIVQSILAALATRSNVRAWRMNTGGATLQNKEGGRLYHVRFGRRGQADISGIIDVGDSNGIRLEIEVKRPGELPTPDQKAFGAEILQMGGIWFVATSAEEALKFLDSMSRSYSPGP